MDTIRVIGLGTGKLEDLTVKAYNVLKENIPTYLRTDRHPIVKQMDESNIKYSTFDNYFVENDTFDEIYKKIVEKIVAEVKKYGKINYCIPGSAIIGDNVTEILLKEYKDDVNIEFIDGSSFIEKCIKLSGYSDYKNIKVLDCLEVDEFSFDVNSLNIITQIDCKETASALKIVLMESYPEDTEILKIDVLENTVNKVPLFSIDLDKNYEFSTYFCILPIETYKKTLYNIENLLRIIKLLRGPEGCPWDRKQTHDSCKDNVIEEANEVVEAINNEDYDNLCEELGDLLIQVVFHSEMASEEGYFNFSDVVTGVCSKLIRRHPHVFGDEVAITVEQALESWEKEKQKEKNK